MAAKVKFPAGTKQDEYRGNAMVQFGDGEHPPQFGLVKAKIIGSLKAAKVDDELIVGVANTWSRFGAFSQFSAELIVKGAAALVTVGEQVAAEKAKAKAA